MCLEEREWVLFEVGYLQCFFTSTRLPSGSEQETLLISYS